MEDKVQGATPIKKTKDIDNIDQYVKDVAIESSKKIIDIQKETSLIEDNVKDKLEENKNIESNLSKKIASDLNEVADRKELRLEKEKELLKYLSDVKFVDSMSDEELLKKVKSSFEETSINNNIFGI